MTQPKSSGRLAPTETHMIHEDTVREVLAQVPGIVRCECEQCVERPS